MTLTRLTQQQHRTSQTLMRRAVALHSLNTLRKTHRRTSRRQISRSNLAARRSVTVTRLRLNRRALDGAQRLLSLLLLNPHPLNLRQHTVTRRHARLSLREAGLRLLQLRGSLLNIAFALGSQGLVLGAGGGKRLGSFLMCLGRPVLSQFVGASLLVSLVFTLFGGVQVGALNQLLTLGNLCGGGVLDRAADRAGFAVLELARQQRGRLGEAQHLQVLELLRGYERLLSRSLPLFLSLLLGGGGALALLLSRGDRCGGSIQLLLHLLGGFVLLLRLGDQVRGEGTFLVGGAVAGELFSKLLGGGGEVAQRLFGTRFVLLEGVSLLQQGGCGGFFFGELSVLLLQGAQGVEERLQLGFLLGGLEGRECGEGGLLREGGLRRNVLIAQCRKQSVAVLLQRGCTGRLLLLAGGERLGFSLDLRVLRVQRCGGTRLRQLFTLCLMLVGAFGQAGAAFAELLVFAPVCLQLGAFGE